MLLVLVVGGFDYAMLVQQKSSLQSAADTAAVASAKGLSLADARRENVDHVAQAIVDGMVRANTLERVGTSAPLVATRVKAEPLEVEVSIRQPVRSSFGGRFGLSVNEITVRSVARVIGSPNICVLALETAEPGAIHLESRSRLTGNDCAVFSNSGSSQGLTVRDAAMLTASTICTAGGVLGRGSISPDPYVDCPRFEDPLAERPEPDAGACDHVLTIVLAQVRTLSPGVYCGGLTITGSSEVTFEPGIYVIRNGLFTVSGASSIAGHGVGFYLQGASSFLFDPLTRISLAAPTDGPMAGLLFFGSRSQSKLLVNTILSGGAQLLTGTIYLPTTSFVADSLARIGSASAYTAIVTRRLTLLDGPNLVLNANYGDTDVPVPEGIKAIGQAARLVK